MPLWTPLQSTTSLWLDASDASTITISTGVSEWRDKSGNSRHVLQASGGLQPLLSSGAVNGLDVVGFNSGKYLANATAQLPLANRSIFIVFAEYSPVANACALSIKGSGLDYSSTDGHIIGPSNKTLSRFISTGSASSSYELVDKTAPVSAACKLGVYADVKTATSGSLYVNGLLKATDSTFTQFSSLSAGGYALGCRHLPGISAPYLNGYIAEIIVGPTDNREKFEGYLAWKWGLQALLDASHLYKTSAPTTDVTGTASFVDPLHSFAISGTSAAPSFGDAEFSLPIDSFNGSGYSDAFSSSAHFTTTVDEFLSYGFAEIVGNVKFKQPATKNNSIGFSGDQIYAANFTPNVDCFSSKGQSTIIGRVVFSGRMDKIIATGDVKSISIGSASFVGQKNIFLSHGSATIISSVEFKDKICALSASGVHHIVGRASFENKIDTMRSRGLEIPSVGIISYSGKFGIYPPPQDLEPSQNITPIKFSRN